jgi:hypothetical protein
MLFDEVIWPVLVLSVAVLAIWRAKSFYARLGVALDWVGVNISETLAITLRVLAALLMGFVLLYFLVTSVQMVMLKPAVFHRCLPDRTMPERILKCFLGNPYKYIPKSNG